MKFAVSKSPPVMVVAPSFWSSSTTGKKTKLSSWDRSFVSHPTSAFLVFDRGIELPVVEAIKKALSEALVHYYPVAGRLAIGGDDEESNGGEVYIACTGEGVPFVAATANCTFKDSKLLDVPSAGNDLLDDLVVYYAADGCSAADPLLHMQVTEFTCGGFVVGVTWNHVLADGDGMAQFLQAVGELTRGMTAPSVVPSRDADGVSLPLLSRAVVAAKQWLLLSRGGINFAYLEITVPSALISRIKSDFAAAAVHSGAGDENSNSYCTTFEVVTAVLWQCRTRAIGSDPDTTALLSFFVNVRKHVGATAGYYGNCVVGQVAMATAGEVASSDIVDLVKLIKHAKESVSEILEDSGDGGEAADGGNMNDMTEEELASLFGYDAFVVSSWRNIGFQAADFGGGTPARVLSNWQQSTTPGCVALLPYRDNDDVDGEVVQAQFLSEEHVEPFLAQLAKLSSSSSP